MKGAYSIDETEHGTEGAACLAGYTLPDEVSAVGTNTTCAQAGRAFTTHEAYKEYAVDMVPSYPAAPLDKV